MDGIALVDGWMSGWWKERKRKGRRNLRLVRGCGRTLPIRVVSDLHNLITGLESERQGDARSAPPIPPNPPASTPTKCPSYNGVKLFLSIYIKRKCY